MYKFFLSVNLNVKNDPFATPGVDPFGNMKSSTSSDKTAIKTSKSSTTRHISTRKDTNVQGLDKEPVVGAENLKTENAAISSGTSTSQTNNVQNAGTTVSKENRRTDVNAVKASDTASSNSRSSNRRVPRKRNKKQKKVIDTTTRSNRQQNRVNQEVSRQSITGTQSNTAKNSKGQTSSTRTVVSEISQASGSVQLNPQAVRTSNTDTRNALRKDGAFSSDIDFNGALRRDEQIGMEFDVPTTEKPIRYFRQLFADQSTYLNISKCI